ncbi:MAG TPA: hypothetical protein PLQ97_10310 [Myxococcota bacterium]|nr:hypothetical protein [Myxococcota bacterium]HQK51297.1 hypothetical protein [Myxococcota bacterium]
MGFGRRWIGVLILAASCRGGASGLPGRDVGDDLPSEWGMPEDVDQGSDEDQEPPRDLPREGNDQDLATGDSGASDSTAVDPGGLDLTDSGGPEVPMEDLAPADLQEDDSGGGDEAPGETGGMDLGSDEAPGDTGGLDPGRPDLAVEDPGVADPGADAPVGPTCERLLPDLLLSPAWPSGPRPNTWSWDGSWTPRPEDFPLEGLYDDEYFDGHRVEGRPTPILPPGRWDWNDADNDLANWRNFYTNLGEFQPLRDGCDRPFGWRFLPKYPEAVDFSGPGEYFEGSSGMDLLLLGPQGNLSSITGSLGGGPDVLVFGRAWSLDYRTGATGDPGADRDDDLVVAGCLDDAGLDYPVRTMTVHAGPGADVLFARNIRAAALDAGNGAGGRTDTLDPTDGDDWVILGGNVKDVRVFGGHGNDVLFWYVDEMNESTPYQGGDFFGGGGYGEAVFGDPGIDRIVLVVPGDTRIVDRPSSPPQRGTLLVMRENGGSDEPWYDEPTLQDPYARYCITCGRGPGGERTLFVQYASADGRIDTGYVSVTAFEELQVGVGPDARVYRLDAVAGRAVAAPDLVPLDAPAYPFDWCLLR